MYFRSYRVGKTCLRNCLTSRFLEQHRIVNILKAPKLCWNLRNGSFLYFSPLLDILGSKKSLIVISKIFVLFVYLLTADDRYSLCNKDNLQQPIQMELCKKQKLLSRLSTESVEVKFYFQHFRKKDEPRGACFSPIKDRKGRRFLNVKNALFQDTLGQSTY